MSRITNQIARDIAKKLTEAKRKEIAIIEEEINTKAYGLQLNAIPAMVLNTFSKFPNYFNSTTSLQLSGPGLDYQFVRFKHKLPHLGQYLHVAEDDANEFAKLFNLKDDKQKELKRLEKEVEVSLINLRTYKNVEVSFPEAFKLLPVLSANKALTIDLSQLRTQLT